MVNYLNIISVWFEFETPNMKQWGAFYLFIANFFAAQNIGGAKELVVLLWLGGNI